MKRTLVVGQRPQATLWNPAQRLVDKDGMLHMPPGANVGVFGQSNTATKPCRTAREDSWGGGRPKTQPWLGQMVDESSSSEGQRPWSTIDRGRLEDVKREPIGWVVGPVALNHRLSPLRYVVWWFLNSMVALGDDDPRAQNGRSTGTRDDRR